MWDAGTWREMTHPAQPADPKAPRAYCDPVRFWQSDEIKGKFPRLNAIAMWWLSVPLSSVCVERSFSLLDYMQDSNRMSMTDESIMNEIFVRCHRTRIEHWAAMEFAAMKCGSCRACASRPRPSKMPPPGDRRSHLECLRRLAEDKTGGGG